MLKHATVRQVPRKFKYIQEGKGCRKELLVLLLLTRLKREREGSISHASSAETEAMPGYCTKETQTIICLKPFYDSYLPTSRTSEVYKLA